MSYNLMPKGVCIALQHAKQSIDECLSCFYCARTFWERYAPYDRQHCGNRWHDSFFDLFFFIAFMIFILEEATPKNNYRQLYSPCIKITLHSCRVIDVKEEM